MELIVFSDLHIHNYSKFSTGTSRLNDTLNLITAIFKFADSNSIDHILFAGDLYDKQKHLPVVVVNETLQRFNSLFKQYPDIKFYAISGNHDLATRNVDNEYVSSVQHLTVFDNFYLLDNTYWKIEEDVHIAGIPYCHTREQFDDCLNELINVMGDRRPILMVHQQPDEHHPGECSGRDRRFKEFEHVFCGHIHQYDRISSQFTLVGNPIHRDLGDAGQEKGFLIYDTDTNDHEFISTRGLYPEFKKAENEEDVPDDSEDFWVVKPTPIESANELKHDFDTGMELVEIFTNYWREVEGKDEELLKTGIEICKRLI